MSHKTISKKQRSTNFTFYEKELLLKHALQNQHVLENKESNAVTWKDKQKCWLKITEQDWPIKVGYPVVLRRCCVISHRLSSKYACFSWNFFWWGAQKIRPAVICSNRGGL